MRKQVTELPAADYLSIARLAPDPGRRALALTENKLKRAIREGRPVIGFYCQTLHPSIVEIMGKHGVDFVILDTEHNGYDIADCTEAVRAAELAQMTPLIRVYDNSPGLINKALEIGAAGVVIPHVDNPESALAAVQATKYPPVGARGVYSGTRAAGYAQGPEEWDRVWQLANEEVMVVIQPLESTASLNSLSAIVSVPGIDLVSLGIGDLSQILGAPGRPNDPRVQEARERALAICTQHGVACYAIASTASDVASWYEKGVRVFVCGSEVAVLQRGFTDLLAKLKLPPQ